MWTTPVPKQRRDKWSFQLFWQIIHTRLESARAAVVVISCIVSHYIVFWHKRGTESVLALQLPMCVDLERCYHDHIVMTADKCDVTAVGVLRYRCYWETVFQANNQQVNKVQSASLVSFKQSSNVLICTCGKNKKCTDIRISAAACLPSQGKNALSYF